MQNSCALISESYKRAPAYLLISAFSSYTPTSNCHRQTCFFVNYIFLLRRHFLLYSRRSRTKVETTKNSCTLVWCRLKEKKSGFKSGFKTVVICKVTFSFYYLIMAPKRPKTKTTSRKLASKRQPSPDKNEKTKKTADVEDTDTDIHHDSPKRKRPPTKSKRIVSTTVRNSSNISSNIREPTEAIEAECSDSVDSDHEVRSHRPTQAHPPYNSEVGGEENSLASRAGPHYDSDSSYPPDIDKATTSNSSQVQKKRSHRSQPKNVVHTPRTPLLTPSKVLQERMRDRLENSGTETPGSMSESGKIQAFQLKLIYIMYKFNNL